MIGKKGRDGMDLVVKRREEGVNKGGKKGCWLRKAGM